MDKKIVALMAFIVLASVVTVMTFVLQGSEILIAILLTIVATSIVSAIIMIRVTKSKDRRLNWLEDRLDSWNNVSYHVTRAGDEAFNKLPVGIVLFDDDYTVNWD